MSKSKLLVEASATVRVDESWVALASKAAKDNQALLLSACAVGVVCVLYLTVKVVVNGFRSVVQALARPMDSERSK